MEPLLYAKISSELKIYLKTMTVFSLRAIALFLILSLLLGSGVFTQPPSDFCPHEHHEKHEKPSPFKAVAEQVKHNEHTVEDHKEIHDKFSHFLHHNKRLLRR